MISSYMQALNTLIKKKHTRATNGKVEVWTVMFNAMCPAELAAEGSYAFWEGKLCSGTEVQLILFFDRNKFTGSVLFWMFNKGFWVRGK